VSPTCSTSPYASVGLHTRSRGSNSARRCRRRSAPRSTRSTPACCDGRLRSFRDGQRRPGRNDLGELFDVGVVKANAPMADAGADARRIVGAMYADLTVAALELTEDVREG